MDRVKKNDIVEYVGVRGYYLRMMGSFFKEGLRG